MGGFPRFPDYFRGKPVVVGFDKVSDTVIAVFIVAAHSGGQLRKVHVLAQVAAVVAVKDNGGGVFCLYLLQASPVLRGEGVVGFKVDVIAVP